MLCLILIVGGLLIMMGQHDCSEALFYYFRLEDQVPENHLLRLIEKHIRFAFVREKLKQSYSETGRPSIDPELLLRILLIGYLYGVTSERKLVEELRMHLAWRWFTGLGTYLGGGQDIDDAFGIAVDSAGSAYVTGETASPDFPTTPNAFRTVIGGSNDAFVTKLNTTGSALVYSTFVGGSQVDFGVRIQVDSAGRLGRPRAASKSPRPTGPAGAVIGSSFRHGTGLAQENGFLLSNILAWIRQDCCIS